MRQDKLRKIPYVTTTMQNVPFIMQTMYNVQCIMYYVQCTLQNVRYRINMQVRKQS